MGVIGDVILDTSAVLAFGTLAFIAIQKDAWLAVIFVTGLGIAHLMRAISQHMQDSNILTANKL